MKRLLQLSVLFILLNNYAQVEFENHQIIKNQPDAPMGVSSTYYTDIDGDGDIDLLSASGNDNEIAWYENIDGQGNFGLQKKISNTATNAKSVFAIDIDNDGDIDVLSASFGDNKIAWYENIDGLGNFSQEHIISTSANGALSVFAIDIDYDGDMDVLSASSYDNKIAWYENIDGLGNFSQEHIISTNTNGANLVSAIDIDQDGKVDVLSTSLLDNKIAWYKNNGLGIFGTERVITTNANGVSSIFTSDIDNDGDIDIVSASWEDDKIAWYQNNGTGIFTTEQIISLNADGALSVFVTDMDNDGDMDILSASYYDGKIGWYENMNGQGNFSSEQIISNLPYASQIITVDIDSDNNIDIILSSIALPSIVLLKNNDGLENFNVTSYVTTNGVNGTKKSVSMNDIDGDGDIDIITSSRSGHIFCFENIDGQGNFEKQILLYNSFNSTDYPSDHNFLHLVIHTTDVDGDGDIDIITSLGHANEMAWYKNLDGLGHFSEAQEISNYYTDFITSITSADIDYDGDIDIIYSAQSQDNNIVWLKNLDGNGNFSSPITITAHADQAMDVKISDLDNDGFIDIISASQGQDKIGWYKNDGLGVFDDERIITNNADAIQSIFVTDLDNDGDNDILSASFFDNKIAWYENLGLGIFDNQNIISTNLDGAEYVYAIDLDNDGDKDVLSASRFDDKIAWYENIGNGNFGLQNIIIEDTANLHRTEYIFSADFDGDSDMDLIYASQLDQKLVWYENLSVLTLNENSSSNFKFFPIPSSNFLNIETKIEITKIVIYNFLGKLVLENINQNRINISNLKNGLYYCKVLDENGDFEIKKIIKN